MKYNELIQLKKEICNSYIEWYKSQGYKIEHPLPLDNKDDITLDFTTCTICLAKENIKKIL